jgi:ABC-type transport system substrate-binding protein
VSQLLNFENGHGAPASGKIVGDLVQSWETPDPTTIVFKLNPAAKFDSREPTNGRAVTAEDVAQAWKRWSAEYAGRTTTANSANKDAPVSTMEAVDPKTVRVKLAFPDALALPLIAGNSIYIQPMEGISGKFDQTTGIRGSGPFILEEYKQSVGATFKRNPNGWHVDKALPYFDAVNASIIGAVAQTEVQFRSKNLHMLAVSIENIPPFAKELKDTKIALATPTSQGPYWGFSYAPDQPWHDVRVRRAVSMSLDRETFAKVLFDPKAFEAVGVKLDVFWNNPLSAGFGDYWLDPKGKNLGPGAAYLQHNVAEAKKLLAAAGFGDDKPLTFDVIYPGLQYGRDYPTRVETWQSMAAEAGIKAVGASIDYTEYIPKYFRGKAKFEGKANKWAVHYPPGGGGTFDPLAWMLNHLSKTGTSSSVGDKFPELDDMIQKQRQVTDVDARRDGIQTIERWVADNVVNVPTGPVTQAVDLIWNKLHGPGEIQAWTGNFPREVAYAYYWMDGQIG